MKIKNDYDLDNLVRDYGFKKNTLIDHNIYIYEIYKDKHVICDILINTTEKNDRIIRFYYYDDLEDKINLYYHDGKINEFSTDPVDYDVAIPDIIFEMIKDNVVEI
jgi:hypothetical protein